MTIEDVLAKLANEIEERHVAINILKQHVESPPIGENKKRHWTQLPGNRSKVIAMTKKRLKTRKKNSK